MRVFAYKKLKAILDLETIVCLMRTLLYGEIEIHATQCHLLGGECDLCCFLYGYSQPCSAVYWKPLQSINLYTPLSLTHSCLVNLIDVTLTCEDANSKLVEVLTVADVGAEDHIGNN